jgi:hypothetical protein
MREFTREERKTAALAVAHKTDAAARLRSSTVDMIAEAWTGGELTYCVSNQYAIQLLCELTEARKEIYNLKLKHAEKGHGDYPEKVDG